MSGESRKARNIVRELDLEPEQVLLGRARKRIASLGELERRCLARLSAHIWSTCCWPDAMGENGWKIGDFKFVVVSTGAGEIYVQFWSEPREIVSAEVSSGEWSPATLKHLGREQRQVLTSLGYVIGGEAGNFQKEVEITTSAQAEAAAREVLHILFDVFGYRGQWPIWVRMTEGERAVDAPTYTALAPEDFAKLASAEGLKAAVAVNPEENEPPLVLLRRGRRRSIAVFEAEGDSNMYRLITLRTLFKDAPDEAIVGLNGAMRFLKFRRADDGDLIVEMPLSLEGGVSAGWLTASLAHWEASCRQAEALLRKGFKVVRLRDADTSVH